MLFRSTSGLAATLAHMGRIGPGEHLLETPVGDVRIQLHDANRVTLVNVPSYRYRSAVELEVPGHGRFRGAVAWGGHWFFLLEHHSLGLELANADRASFVVHHEVGHNADTALGTLSTGRGQHLFGQGDTVSSYAARNAAEDFAETHRVLVRDWDEIMGDPQRYLDGSDVGIKLAFVLDEVYAIQPGNQSWQTRQHRFEIQKILDAADD